MLTIGELRKSDNENFCVGLYGDRCKPSKNLFTSALRTFIKPYPPLAQIL